MMLSYFHKAIYIIILLLELPLLDPSEPQSNNL